MYRSFQLGKEIIVPPTGNLKWKALVLPVCIPNFPSNKTPALPLDIAVC